MGVMATLMGLIETLKRHSPDVSITLLSYRPEKYHHLERLGITLLQHPWWRPWGKAWPFSTAILVPWDFLRCTLLRLLKTLGIKVATPYERYDVVIDNNTEHLNEVLYGSVSVTSSLLQTWLAKIIFHRPIATTPSSAGPFKTKFNRWLARYVLKRVDLFALREEANIVYCGNLGLEPARVRFVSDPGFLLAPVSPERTTEIMMNEGVKRTLGHPLVGLSPNWFEMERFAFGSLVDVPVRRDQYIRLMAEVIDEAVERLGAEVCIIPHVLGGLLSISQNNDRDVGSRILHFVRNSDKVTLLRGDYMPDELKGVIGACDLFIGGRMHATIASTSLAVPTITVSYGEKYYRIIGDTMGQAEYIVDITNPDYDALLNEMKMKIDSLWKNRDTVRAILRERASRTWEIAMSYGSLVREIGG